MNRQETIRDLCCGLALIYLGPDGESDPYTDRLFIALKENNAEEMEHITALLISMLYGRGQSPPQFALDTWAQLWGT